MQLGPDDGLDWDVLSEPGVESVVEAAAQAVSRHEDYGPHVELDDLRQEAFVRVAQISSRARLVNDPDSAYTHGTLKHELECDLIDMVRPLAFKGQRNESYEARYMAEGEEGYTPDPVQSVIRNEVGAYTDELVEKLIPAIWDDNYCYGMKVENAPDQDMPRGSSNKATGNTLAAHIADIKWAWEAAPLTTLERRALVLAHGLDWSNKDIAFNQQCNQPTVSKRVRVGVNKLRSTLNGASDLGVLPETGAA